MKRQVVSIAAILLCGTALAEPAIQTGYNTYGTAGLIEMPTANAMPDGELAYTFSYSRNTKRHTLTFQIAPRLSGSFRYALLYDQDPNSGPDLNTSTDFRFDRSFTLQYLISEETDKWPAFAVGLNDFLGTGVYRSEYLVASKTITPQFRVTGGIGWGRLAGVGGFDNPLGHVADRFKTRDERISNRGGEVEASQIFRGDAAFFGGVEYQVTDKLKLTAEYSSDRYELEDGATFDYVSPFNFGVSYQARKNINLKAHYLYGAEVGVQLTFALNPKNPPNYSGLEKAPPAVVPRRSAAALGWSGGAAAGGPGALQQRAATALGPYGIGLHGLEVSGTQARIEIDNRSYLTQAQAIGRSARAMTGVLPPQVETMVIVPVRNGIAGAQVTLRRSDLEALEFELDGAWDSYARAGIASAPGQLAPAPGRYPFFDYKIGPYFATSLFDPDNPFRADLGIETSARYEALPGLVFQGAVRKKLVGNLNESTRPSTSVLQRVRSESNIYEKHGDPALTHLTGSYYFKPADDLYGRVTAGYLEKHFGGVSTELLWKPVDSRLAAGIEVNYVKQRAFDQRFGFRDYEVATGHASVYYDLGNGYQAQVDAGRYLAGDWGATLSLDRTFKNGWSIGAFATLTDVPFDEFGEGSFDKGIRISIPIGWVNGQRTRDTYATVIRPVTRDGGARVHVNDRLYETVRDTHQPALAETWGRFWR
ncbi:MAG: YjbH domain-containing protein [Rhodobacteraceae bacterium]|nr:MAG: YjbH domain-containing protein [Paracoccaceae bacterium]